MKSSFCVILCVMKYTPSGVRRSPSPLLVAFESAVDAVELPRDCGLAVHGLFDLKEQLARFVGGKKIFRSAGGQAGRPVGRGLDGQHETENKKGKEAEQRESPWL